MTRFLRPDVLSDLQSSSPSSSLLESDHKMHVKYHIHKMNKQDRKKINIRRNTYQYIEIIPHWKYIVVGVKLCQKENMKVNRRLDYGTVEAARYSATLGCSWEPSHIPPHWVGQCLIQRLFYSNNFAASAALALSIVYTECHY